MAAIIAANAGRLHTTGGAFVALKGGPMNWDQIEKNLGMHFDIRPRPIGLFNPDSLWALGQVDKSDRTLELSNIETGHALRLHGDAIKGFLHNAQARNRGYLQLRVQVIVEDCNIRCEPLP